MIEINETTGTVEIEDLDDQAVLETETEETQDLDDMVQDLVTEVGHDQITPYGIHTIINTILAAYDVKTIIPQHMYNYDRNGMIVKGQKGQKRYSGSEVTAFVIKFVSKRI
jgi:hypothetical protein